MTLEFIAQMAATIGKPITVTTGTNHSKMSASGKSQPLHRTRMRHRDVRERGDGRQPGRRQDHGGRVPPGRRVGGVRAHQGAQRRLFTFTHNNQRIQCIWKTMEGGNHHNQVHVGVRPA